MDAGPNVFAGELVHVDGLPFLGALFPIRRNALEFFSRMLRKYGDRVRLRVLSRKVILLCHPDDIEAVLVKDRDSFGALQRFESYDRSLEMVCLRVMVLLGGSIEI
jgi:hypothetical protein